MLESAREVTLRTSKRPALVPRPLRKPLVGAVGLEKCRPFRSARGAIEEPSVVHVEYVESLDECKRHSSLCQLARALDPSSVTHSIGLRENAAEGVTQHDELPDPAFTNSLDVPACTPGIFAAQSGPNRAHRSTPSDSGSPTARAEKIGVICSWPPVQQQRHATAEKMRAPPPTTKPSPPRECRPTCALRIAIIRG